MEGNGVEEYTRSVLDIRPGEDKAALIFKNLVSSPLPYSGAVASPLSELPKGYDNVRVLTSPPQTFTTWNIQSHAILVSYGSAPHEAVEQECAAERPCGVPTILMGEALASAIKIKRDLNLMQIEGLNTGKRWLTTRGEVVKKLDPRAKFRCATLVGKALEVFKRGPPLPERQGEASTSASRTPEPGTSQSFCDLENIETFVLAGGSSNMDLTDVPEPPPTGTPERIPLRVVQPTLVSIQGPGPVTVPKSQAYTGMEAYISERGTSSQGLVPGTRSVLARDTPSVAYLVSHMEGSNASFIDAAPMLRALLYIFPAHADAWEVDKIDRQFIRGQVDGTRSALTVQVYDIDAALRVQMQLICTTLPAFAEHIKGVDTLLGNPDPAISHGFNIGELDSSWTVVPVDSHTLTQPWLLEYIVAFMSTSHWNGRLNWVWHANYTGNANEVFRGNFTTIPAAHNVYVPGPDKVMLVLLEDSGYAHNRTIQIPNHAGNVNVYFGVRAGAAPPANLDNFLVDITNSWHGVLTTQNYTQSAQRMLHALHYMEKNLSTNMAFASAVTLASELANVMPEGPQIRLNPAARNYTDMSYGLWTYGARDTNNRTPRMRSNDVNLGDENQRANRLASMVAAYSYSMLSPCLQYAASSTQVLSRDIIANGVYVGQNVRWANQVPESVQPQYTCHQSHSVYRVLRCLGYTIKNDYSYNLSSLGGLQNTLANNGVLLTLGLTLAMATNDVSLKVWSGLGGDDIVAAHMSSRNLVSNWTNKMVLQRHPNAFFAHTNIRAGVTVDNAFEAYYGRDSEDAEWATHIPIPMYALAQWAMKCGIELGKDFHTEYGRVTDQVTARYSVFKYGNHPMLALAAGSADILATAPASYQQHMTVGSVGLPMCFDNWADLTSGSFQVDIRRGKFQSNVLSVSMRYHHQDTSNDCQVAIVNDFLASKLSFASILSVDPLLYPDPPNPEVFRVTREGQQAAKPPQDKRQEAPPTKALEKEQVAVASVQRTEQTTGVIEQVATGPKQNAEPTVVVPAPPATQTSVPTVSAAPPTAPSTA